MHYMKEKVKEGTVLFYHNFSIQFTNCDDFTESLTTYH